MYILKAISLSTILSYASALSSTVAPSPNTIQSIYGNLKSTPMTRASDNTLVSLPSLWRSNTPFGIADEVAVCAFLRHFG